MQTAARAALSAQVFRTSEISIRRVNFGFSHLRSEAASPFRRASAIIEEALEAGDPVYLSTISLIEITHLNKGSQDTSFAN